MASGRGREFHDGKSGQVIPSLGRSARLILSPGLQYRHAGAEARQTRASRPPVQGCQMCLPGPDLACPCLRRLSMRLARSTLHRGIADTARGDFAADCAVDSTPAQGGRRPWREFAASSAVNSTPTRTRRGPCRRAETMCDASSPEAVRWIVTRGDARSIAVRGDVPNSANAVCSIAVCGIGCFKDTEIRKRPAAEGVACGIGGDYDTQFRKRFGKR